MNNPHSSIEVAAYYFPNYHIDSRNESLHGPGWTEWDLVRRAEPRFTGHEQPLVPAWGYEDESDPEAMDKKINCAADHGIDAFIFDWYYYEDGPFLQNAIDRGFLHAPNRNRLKFALMWANHDWVDIHPAKALAPTGQAPLLYPGAVSRSGFERLARHAAEHYMLQPNYWRVGGKPYFSIYDLSSFLAGMGSLENARRALDDFRALAKTLGLPGLHLNAVIWNEPILPGEKSVLDPAHVVAALGFDSFSSYVWVHHVPFWSFPKNSYTEVKTRYFEYWNNIVEQIELPYIPNVTMGWDPTPRITASDRHRPSGYPFTAVISDNTPENFRAAVYETFMRLEKASSNRSIVTINAWNEWTEGSYLEPNQTNGLKYLEAIKEAKAAFCPTPNDLQ